MITFYLIYIYLIHELELFMDSLDRPVILQFTHNYKIQ